MPFSSFNLIICKNSMVFLKGNGIFIFTTTSFISAKYTFTIRTSSKSCYSFFGILTRIKISNLFSIFILTLFYFTNSFATSYIYCCFSCGFFNFDIITVFIFFCCGNFIVLTTSCYFDTLFSNLCEDGVNTTNIFR